MAKHNPVNNLGTFAHPPKGVIKIPLTRPVPPAAKPAPPPVRAMPNMKPNTTAPAKARSVTAGPNRSFPIGDKTHAKLAIGGATRSYNAGNIGKATENSIKTKAENALGKKGGKK